MKAAGCAVVLLSLSGWACAHTDEAGEAREKAQERETAVLKERVARLERRTSDLDARMALLAGRMEEGGGDAVASSDPPTTKLPPPPEEKAPPKIGIGREAVDIVVEPEPDPEPARVSSTDPAPVEDMTDEGGASGDDVVVIDAAALRKFGLEDEATIPPAAKPAPAPARKAKTKAAPGHAPVKTVYDRAHLALREGRYNTAIEGFDEVMRRFPKHHLADNALYWTGVAHQRRGAYADAVRAFEKVPVRFPRSAKIPDALFGLAEIAEAQGDRALASRIYAQLVKRYPKAERAGDARSALARLSGPS